MLLEFKLRSVMHRSVPRDTIWEFIKNIKFICVFKLATKLVAPYKLYSFKDYCFVV